MKRAHTPRLFAALVFFVVPIQAMSSGLSRVSGVALGASALAAAMLMTEKTEKEKLLEYLAHLELELNKLPVCEIPDISSRSPRPCSCTPQELEQLYSMKNSMHRALSTLSSMTSDADRPEFNALHARMNSNLHSHYVVVE